jgi:hypothetical protein
MPGKRPTFLGIGAQKAGTTWMYEQLRAHADIWMPPIKEIQYFDRSTLYASPNILAHASALRRMADPRPWSSPWTRLGFKSFVLNSMRRNFELASWWRHWTFGKVGDAWYRQLFAHANPHQECGEFTTSYAILLDADVARIKAINPDIRLIFLLRNPIDRAWSAIRRGAKIIGGEVQEQSMEQIILMLQSQGMRSRGDYNRTIETYLRHFDASQMLLGFYDAIVDNPRGLMDGITEFLGVKPSKPGAINHGVKVNASPVYAMPEEVREYMADMFKSDILDLADRYGGYARRWAEELAVPSGGDLDPKDAADLCAVMRP